jgi:pimeloyl-ACP methyl ester carboxylesterase
MEIERVNIHFIGMFSEKKDAVPIIFMHGWPSSFVEFLPMAEVIRNKYKIADLPYHVIVASLPGYTLSNPLPTDKDWSPHDTARVMDTLMSNLGFEKYIAHGGDFGSKIATHLSLDYEKCVGAHCKTVNQYKCDVDILILY